MIRIKGEVETIGRASDGVRYDLRRGLSAEEVTLSRERQGDNRLSHRHRASFMRQFIGNFSDPIIRILLGALILNALVSLGHINWLESGGIAAAILISTLVSTVSEYSQAAAFETLRDTAEDSAVTVRRDGERCEIPMSSVVVGDVLFLSPGMTVPADGILTAGEVRLDQSSLDGESEARKKTAHPLFLRAPRGEYADGMASLSSPHALYRGSRVSDGEGEMLVLEVGDRTLYGSVAAELQEETRPSPLRERLHVLARSISFLGYVAAAAIGFAVLFHAFVIESGMEPAGIRERLTDAAYAVPVLIRALTVAISVLVVAVPEGLPMMITVVLSSNTKKMLRAGVLVRRLVGIETAGSLDILFTDKTGTLTTGQLSVAAVVAPGRRYTSLAALRGDGPLWTSLRRCEAGCAALGRGNATEGALRAFFGEIREDEWRVRDRIPFSSERRCSTGTVEVQRRVYTEMRGAPEVLLTRATHYLDADGRVRRLTPVIAAELRSEWQSLASSAHRVIASMEECEGEAILLALIAIRDRIRRDAPPAVAEARAAGIQTVMITGDNPLTAAAIARECGILTPGGDGVLLTGIEMEEMTDDALLALLPRLAVVARALPGDKSRLVRLAASAGRVVGMTGDGINDAPALRAADVGFSMGSGTDAAREASDIVITDDRFSSILQAVLFGRTVLRSIRKFIVFQLTMNLCAVGVSLIGPFIGVEAPVTVIQMLWVNIIMDTLGALAFAGEPALREYMRCPPTPRGERLLTRSMTGSILGGGLYSLALSLWFLRSPAMHRLFSRGDEVYYLTVFFALFIFCGIANCFTARAERVNLLAHLSQNPSFILIILTVAAVQLMILYFGGSLFRCDPLTVRELLLAAALACTVFPANALCRLFLRRRRKG